MARKDLQNGALFGKIGSSNSRPSELLDTVLIYTSDVAMSPALPAGFVVLRGDCPLRLVLLETVERVRAGESRQPTQRVWQTDAGLQMRKNRGWQQEPRGSDRTGAASIVHMASRESIVRRLARRRGSVYGRNRFRNLRTPQYGLGLPPPPPPQGPGRRNSGQRPETRDQRPETRDQRPETRDQRPETRDQRPETRDQRPETRDQRPETRDQRPETRDQRPDFSGNPRSVKKNIPLRTDNSGRVFSVIHRGLSHTDLIVFASLSRSPYAHFSQRVQ